VRSLSSLSKLGLEAEAEADTCEGSDFFHLNKRSPGFGLPHTARETVGMLSFCATSISASLGPRESSSESRTQAQTSLCVAVVNVNIARLTPAQLERLQAATQANPDQRQGQKSISDTFPLPAESCLLSVVPPQGVAVTTADSSEALTHHHNRIIVVLGGNGKLIIAYNVDRRIELAKQPMAVPLLFWTFISNARNCLMILTPTSVYAWRISSVSPVYPDPDGLFLPPSLQPKQSPPAKVFDRADLATKRYPSRS